MHKIITTVSAAAILGSACLGSISGASAQSRELNGATCADFMRLPGEDQRVMAIWLSGFYSGSAQSQSIDGQALRNAHGALAKLCTEKTDTPLLGEASRGAVLGSARP
jgi:hypothetical protein